MRSLREITYDNFHECLDLLVKPSQKHFVASNVYSIAEAKINKDLIPLAIYDEDKMVGFVMYQFEKKANEGQIFRLMVDEKYQGKGHGKYALLEVINRLSKIVNCKIVKLSFEPENKEAKAIYLHLGFRETDERWGDEIVVRYDIDA